MSSSNSTMEAYDEPRKPGITGFIALIIIALGAGGFAVFHWQAPYTSLFFEDWIGWAHIQPLGAGLVALAIAMFLIGLLGLLSGLISAAFTKAPPPRRSDYVKASDYTHASDLPAGDALVMSRSGDTRGSLKFETRDVFTGPLPDSAEPKVFQDNASDSFLSQHKTGDAFTGEPVSGSHVVDISKAQLSDAPAPAPSPIATPASATVIPISAAVAAVAAPVAFDAAAALSDNHGLQIGSAPAAVEPAPVAPPAIEAPVVEAPTVAVAASGTSGMNIVEDATPHAPEAHAETHEPVLDPLGVALLADTANVVPSAAPQSDINAVINSAMRFISHPETLIEKDPQPAATAQITTPAEHHDSVLPVAGAALAAAAIAAIVPEFANAAPHATEAVAVPETAPVAAPVAAEPAPVQTAVDHEAEVDQAVKTALSVWPDATRPFVGDELTQRITKLYHDKAPDSAKAFHLIASGDLTAAANALQNQADVLAQVGLSGEAAEIWRIFGALHMGRDDAKAMTAYEKVSELDPLDANIHLYLVRRYQMSGETTKLPAVLSRALAVISDPATRVELLAPYADLKSKAGDAKTAGDAFCELAALQSAAAKPDDIAARSGLGISLARAGQAREVQGAPDQAGQLYKQAYAVFADLSAQKPDHPGLKAMADSAQRDFQRLGA